MEIPVLDTADPNSLISKLPDNLRKVFEAINPKYVEMSEEELVAEVFNAKSAPDIYLKLRVALWKEYEKVRNIPGRKIRYSQVYKGICTNEYFTKTFLRFETPKLAFLLMEPHEYSIESEALTGLSIPEMFRIMRLPDQVNAKTGMIDTSLLALKFKIFQHMEARTHGAIAQNFKHDVNQKNLNLNADITPNAVPNIDQFNSLEEIEARIKELEKPKVKMVTAKRDVLPTDYVTIKTSRGEAIEVLKSDELMNHGRPVKGGS